MWELLERLRVPFDFVFLWQKHDHQPFPLPLEVSCSSPMKKLKIIKSKTSSSDIMVSTREECFESKAAGSSYIAIKGSKLPKLKQFSYIKYCEQVCSIFVRLDLRSFFGTKKSVCESGAKWLAKNLFIFKDLFLADASFWKGGRLSFVMFVQNLKLSGQPGVRSISKRPRTCRAAILQKIAVILSTLDDKILICCS